MIKTLIDIEKRRYAQEGYDTIVSSEDINVVDTEMCVNLGNDTIILTGFVFDDDTTCGEDERVTIVSPSDAISENASKLASFGNGRYKVMRDYMIVKRLNSTTIEYLKRGDDETQGTQSPLTISFIRISPAKRK
ncbi:MAG: hypothetical protein MJZ30_10060 [Paludibacteraceae bacterium]|nr:hypothetical protein [Paludibacteraceae bacterium]